MRNIEKRSRKVLDGEEKNTCAQGMVSDMRYIENAEHERNTHAHRIAREY
jgi:hypothetical protein